MSIAAADNPLSTITATEPLFHARGLTKTYRMGEVDVHALQGVDLDLHHGELVVILGPSGSGKSTLLNILGGHHGAQSVEVIGGLKPGEAVIRHPDERIVDGVRVKSSTR